jgi:hypothetical protein
MSYTQVQSASAVNQWGQDVGLNYLNQGSSGRTMTWTSRIDIWRLLFEPFVTREQGRYSKDSRDIPFGEGVRPSQGSVLLGVRKMAISGFLELCASFLLTVLTVGTVAGAFASGANIVLIGLLAGGVHALGRYASVAARYTPHLPRHLDPGFSWYSWWRGDVGAVIVLVYQVCQYGGAMLGTLLLCNPGLHYRDYFAGASKFGASADLSCFAFWAYYFAALVVIYFVHGFGQTFTSHRYSYAKRYVQVAALQAATIFVLTQFYIHLGIFTLNPIIFATGIVGGGTATAVTGSALDWVIPIFLAPIAAGPVAAFFVWLLWNVNALNREQMNEGYKKDMLNEAGGNGGAVHTPTGRHEVMPGTGAQTVTAQVPQSKQASMVSWILHDASKTD